MSDLFYASNPKGLEGVRANEVAQPGSIQGVSINLMGLVGKCVRGRVDKPIRVTNFARFVEVFGGRDIVDKGALVGEVWKAMLYKDVGEFVVRRVAAAAAVTATKNASDAVPTAIIRIDASSPGTWGNGVTYSIEAASNGVATAFNLRVIWRGQEQIYQDLSCNGTDDNLATTIGDDDGNLVVVTKLASGRPVNAAGVALLAGTDGVIAATDYNNALTDMANSKDARYICVPESLEDTVAAAAQATFNGQIVTAAGASATKVFFTWDGKPANSKAQATAAVSAQITTRSDRIFYAVNATKIVDPITGGKIWQGPHVWAAALASATDYNDHLGQPENERLTAAIKELQFETFDDAGTELKALRDAGASSLERRDTGAVGFHSAVTTSLANGKTELARRRSADFLIQSAALGLKQYLRKHLTDKNIRDLNAAMVGFSNDLKENRATIVKGYTVDTTMNTPATLAKNQYTVLWVVGLVGHFLEIYLAVDARTGAITEVN